MRRLPTLIAERGDQHFLLEPYKGVFICCIDGRIATAARIDDLARQLEGDFGCTIRKAR